MSNMIEIKLSDYIEVLTDYHSGGSYETLKEKTKILYEPDYAVMVRTLNFENDDFYNNLIYCDKDSYDFLEYSHINENDILMNKIANPGSVYIMPKVDYRATCAMNLFLIRFRGINQRYMYYVMKNAEAYIKNQAHGTTTKTITKDEVRDLSFYIHEDEGEREKVAAILTELDYKIQNNKKIIIEIEGMLKSIYSYWFHQFEFPNDDNLPYVSSGGKLVWNDELGREIPEQWEVKRISDCVSFVSGYPFSSADYVEHGKYKLYTIKNVLDGKIESKTDNMIQNFPIKMDKRCLLSVGDIIMSLTGNVGRVGLVYEDNALLNQRVLKIEPKVFGKTYIYSLFRDELMKSKMELIATGTSQKNLSPVKLGEIKIVVPSDAILTKYFDKTSELYKKIIDCQIENQQLMNTKEFLLPMLMNGQIVIQ